MSEAHDLIASERAALDQFQAGAPVPVLDDAGEEAWCVFGLRCLLEAGRALRGRRAGGDGPVALKDDGSPATRLELRVERAVTEDLERFAPGAAFLGEESGGELPDAGWAVALDPVDGTWAFLTETPTWAASLTVFRDGEPFAGFVANPTTGELAWARRGGDARCLRLSAFGEPVAARVLPTAPAGATKLLVSVHPGRDACELQGALQAAWGRGELGVVRSPGGSPAFGLMEAARGHYVYLNAWGGRGAQPFDLAAGVLLVRGAGGEVVDREGAPIDSVRHSGPWVASVDPKARARVSAIVADAWPPRSTPTPRP